MFFLNESSNFEKTARIKLWIQMIYESELISNDSRTGGNDTVKIYRSHGKILVLDFPKMWGQFIYLIDASGGLACWIQLTNSQFLLSCLPISFVPLFSITQPIGTGYYNIYL